MGLIRAALGAAASTLGDQWKEFFYCDSLSKDVLVVKGQKRTSGFSSNNGSNNIISNGSGIAVAEGQCMIIVENGKIVEACAEPGEYTYDTSSEPSIFAGSLGDSIKKSFSTMAKRFTYGGDTAKDQRVYYFNTKELIDNKFGTPNPIMFRVVDSRIGLDLDVSLRCSGVYSYKIDDPILFYTNVCGNVEKQYNRAELESQLKSEFIAALQPAIASLSNLEIRPNQIPAHTVELGNAMNDALSAKWSELRGLKVISVAISTITLPEEDQEMIQKYQKAAILRDPAMMNATIADSAADSMKIAAGNPNGAMAGIMGMGMTMNAANTMGAGMVQAQAAVQASAPAAAPADGWTCACGTVNTGKFCSNCGEKKPEANSWTCSCGTVNTGNFCSNCGSKKPAAVKCAKCGWEPADGAAPKFCPECGNAF